VFVALSPTLALARVVKRPRPAGIAV
jgi:hypothetical protein